jgi:hypothetical protein
MIYINTFQNNEMWKTETNCDALNCGCLEEADTIYYFEKKDFLVESYLRVMRKGWFEKFWSHD